MALITELEEMDRRHLEKHKDLEYQNLPVRAFENGT